MITADQHREWGTWWAGEEPVPQSVLDARKAHGLGPNGEENPEDDAWHGSSSSAFESSSKPTPNSPPSDGQTRQPAPSTGGRSGKARTGNSNARSAGTSSNERKGR